MTLKKLLGSKRFVIVLCTLGALLIAALIFQAGVIVGFHKATFGYRWGENYHRNFGGPENGFMMHQGSGMMQAPHGAFGTVISVNEPSFILEGTDKVEKNILTTKDTEIRKQNISIQFSDIKASDQVVVIGEPNDQGQIIARLIRVFPGSTATTTTSR